MIILSALGFLGNCKANQIAASIAKNVSVNLRKDLFTKIMSLNQSQVDDVTMPSLVARMSSDTYNIHQMCGMILRMGVRAPILLIGGTIAILAFYLIYYISLSACLGNAGTIIQDANAPIAVFEAIMGKVGGLVFTFFILISCLGTVNGVTISCCRGMYTMSCRGMGIAPEKFSKLGKNQSVSLLSCLYGYGCITLMFVVWYLAMHNVWIFGRLGGMDEIVCAIIYMVYIAMYIYIMKNFKEYNVFKRFIMPAIAIIGSLFFTFCGTGLYQLVTTGSTSSLGDFVICMGLFAVLMFPCVFFYKKENVKDLSALNEN